MPHVMLIDDDPVLRTLGGRLLEAIGCSSVTLADGTRIVDELKAAATAGKPVDLVLLDLQLEGASGFDVCRKLRADGVKVPIVCLSAEVEAYGERAVREVGFDGALGKPFSLDALEACVAKFAARGAAT